MKYTLVFTPLEGDEAGFDFTVVERMQHREYVKLKDLGFPTDGLAPNTFVTAVHPKVGSKFDNIRGIFSLELY